MRARKQGSIKNRWLSCVFAAIMLIAATLVVTACDGANSATWRTSVNVQERSSPGSFSISVGSASRGTRNRTFNLTAEDLANIHVNSSSAEGEITLVISQNGEEDGTEIRLDISNFEGYLSAESLSPGRIRFSLRFEGIRDSVTTISWG